jgi:prepilin-type N-terminal cleavage/methylation domain-containing protein
MKGFSLIELIVSLGLFALLSLIITMMTFSSLSVAQKANLVAQARSQGSYALTLMTNQLRYASDLSDWSNCNTDSLSYVDHFFQTTSFSKQSDLTNGDYLASASASVRLTNSGFIISACSDQPTIFACDLPTRTVKVCFVITNKNDTSVGLVYKDQILLRNR